RHQPADVDIGDPADPAAGVPALIGGAHQQPARESDDDHDLDDPLRDVAHRAHRRPLRLTYSGVGTSRHVYAQLVDDKTGLVVGDIVTPVPVTLDGQIHTVTVPLEEVAYTMSPGDTLTLQLVGSAT